MERQQVILALNLNQSQFRQRLCDFKIEDKEEFTVEEFEQLRGCQTDKKENVNDVIKANGNGNNLSNISSLQDEAFLTLGEALQKVNQPASSPNGTRSANILAPFAALEALGGDSATLAMQYAVQKYIVEQEVQGLGEEIYRMLVQLAAEQTEKTTPASNQGIRADLVRGNVDFFHHLETSLREELQLPPAPNRQLTRGA